MAARGDDIGAVNPKPPQGSDGSDLRTVAGQIEGLLDDDGQYNPTPDTPSRGHPDYEADTDSREQPRDDSGRFARKGGAAEDDAGAAGDDEEADDLSATGDDRDADTDDGDTDDDLTASADENAETDDGETVALESLSQLAETLEIPLDDLKEQLSHTFRAADGDVTVTLAELERGYQKDADYRRNTAKLADDRRDFEGVQTQRVQQVTQANQDAGHVIGLAEQIVGAELETPAMAQLRETDQAEWLARREEIGQRLGYLRNMRQQAAGKYQEFMQNQMGELKQRETQALMQAVPDFGVEQRDIAKEAIGSLGYNDTEVRQVLDHRLIVGALELHALRAEVAKLREAKQTGEARAKDVRKAVPKVQKPGRAKPGSRGARVRRDNITKLRARAAKSGKVEDAAKVIENLM